MGWRSMGSRGMFFSFNFALTEFNTIYPLARPCHKVENQPCMLDRMLQSGKTLKIKESLHSLISNRMCLPVVIPPRLAWGYFHPVGLNLGTFRFAPPRFACGFFTSVSLRLVPLRFACGVFHPSLLAVHSTPVCLRLAQLRFAFG